MTDYSVSSSSNTIWKEDRRVNDGDVHFGSWVPHNNKGKVTISLESQSWVRRIKVKTGFVQEGFDSVMVKAGNYICGVQAGNVELPVPGTWIHYLCPEPGVFTDKIEIWDDSGKIAVTEVIISDCPNGFERFHSVSPHCYKILGLAPYGNQSRECQRLSGHLLTTASDDDNQVIIAKIMQTKSLSTVFLGKCPFNNRFHKSGRKLS